MLSMWNNIIIHFKYLAYALSSIFHLTWCRQFSLSVYVPAPSKCISLCNHFRNYMHQPNFSRYKEQFFFQFFTVSPSFNPWDRFHKYILCYTIMASVTGITILNIVKRPVKLRHFLGCLPDYKYRMITTIIKLHSKVAVLNFGKRLVLWYHLWQLHTSI